MIGVLALLWSPIAAANSPADENPGHAECRVLVFGDSLSSAYGMAESAGWPALLRERLQAREPSWSVSNVSISGDTTAGGRSRLGPALEREDPDIVILGLGGNDGLRGLSLRAMRDNLEAMVDAIEAAGGRTLLLGMRIPPNYGSRYTERFEKVFAGVAANREVAFAPFFLGDVLLEEGMLMEDGIHPSAAAQPQLLKGLWPYLLPVLEAVEAAAGC